MIVVCGQPAHWNPADAGTLRSTKSFLRTLDADSLHLGLNKSSLEDNYFVDTSNSKADDIKLKFARARDVKRKSDNAKGVCITLSKRSLNARSIDELKVALRQMKQLRHENIAQFWEAFEDEKNVFLVYEYVGYAEGMGAARARPLMDEVIKLGTTRGEGRRPTWTEEEAKRYSAQIVAALAHAHDKRIVHGNLKAKNLLLDKVPGISGPVCKVTDFCLTPAFKCTSLEDSSALPSEIVQVAPELVVQSEAVGHEIESREADVYAFGVIMFLLLTGRAPFEGVDRATLLAQVKKGNVSKTSPRLWGALSPEARDLIAQTMQLNPKKRISAKRAAAHVWFSSTSRGRPVRIDTQNLEKLGGVAIMRKSIIKTVASALPREKIAELEKKFMAIDRNGNGKVSLEELKNGIRDFPELEIPSDLLALFDEEFDSDSSGSKLELEIGSFIEAVCETQHTITEDVLWQAFKLHDLDGSGSLSTKEMNLVIKEINGQVSEAQINKMMATFDPNGDGVVTFDEFLAAFLSEKPPTHVDACVTSCTKTSRGLCERIVVGKKRQAAPILTQQERQKKIQLIKESRKDLDINQGAGGIDG